LANSSIVYKNYIDLSKDEHESILEKRNFYKKYSLEKDKSISLQEHLQYVKKLNTIDDKIYFAVFFDNKVIFSINIQDIKKKEKSAYWGFFKIDDSVDIYFVLQDFIDYYFDVLGFTTLSAIINLDNQRSVQIHEALGFNKVYEDDKVFEYKLIKE
jgi:RimJ/RimL family protein N-acetyltransferase